MLADFYIHRLSNDMKITVQKNHLVGQILYRSLVPSKKTASKFVIIYLFIMWILSWSATSYTYYTTSDKCQADTDTLCAYLNSVSFKT